MSESAPSTRPVAAVTIAIKAKYFSVGSIVRAPRTTCTFVVSSHDPPNHMYVRPYRDGDALGPLLRISADLCMEVDFETLELADVWLHTVAMAERETNKREAARERVREWQKAMPPGYTLHAKNNFAINGVRVAGDEYLGGACCVVGPDGRALKDADGARAYVYSSASCAIKDAWVVSDLNKLDKQETGGEQ